MVFLVPDFDDITVSPSCQEFLPPTQQTPQHFDEHFQSVGMEALVKYRRAQESAEKRRKLKSELEELLENEVGSDEIVERCQQHMELEKLSDVDITVMVRAEVEMGITVVGVNNFLF